MLINTGFSPIYQHFPKRRCFKNSLDITFPRLIFAISLIFLYSTPSGQSSAINSSILLILRTAFHLQCRMLHIEYFLLSFLLCTQRFLRKQISQLLFLFSVTVKGGNHTVFLCFHPIFRQFHQIHTNNFENATRLNCERMRSQFLYSKNHLLPVTSHNSFSISSIVGSVLLKFSGINRWISYSEIPIGPPYKCQAVPSPAPNHFQQQGVSVKN